MRTYHYSVRIGHGKATFPTVTFGSLLKSLVFYKGHGVQFPWLATSQTHLSALFSFQRSILKAVLSYLNNHCKAGKKEIQYYALPIMIYSSASNAISAISNVKIILINASLNCYRAHYNKLIFHFSGKIKEVLA